MGKRPFYGVAAHLKTGFSAERHYPLRFPVKNASPSETAHPLAVGLHAARANLVPGLIVQAVMASVLLAYFFYPPAREWLERLAEVKARWGYLFACLSGMIAGAVLPELLVVCVFQRGRVRWENVENLLFLLVFWGSQSMIVDALYRFQAILFGTEATALTIVKKVLFDQFVYSPFFAMPVAMICFAWKNNGYRVAGMPHIFSLRFYKETIFPSVVAAWGVWIPVVSMVYSLPPLLQIPLFSLALTFWSMMLTWIGRQQR